MGDSERTITDENITPTERDESTIPKWWEAQQQLIENRFKTLEESAEETRGYLQRLISLTSKEADDALQSSPDIEPAAAEKKRQISLGKQHMHPQPTSTTEKPPLQHDSQGILASRPDFVPQQTQTLKATPPGQPPNQNDSPKRKWGAQYFDLGDTSILKDSQTGDRAHQHTQNSFLPRPKIELQQFEGINPRSWVRKCDKYFSIFNIPEYQKVEMASMYLTGKAETWYDAYIMQKHRVSWHAFVADLCHRFCDKNHSDIIEDFNKLFQTTTVLDYQEKFEELLPFMLQHNCHLQEPYFISSFISGLKEELKHKVKIHEPMSLADAFRKAKLYELALEVESKKPKPTYKPAVNFTMGGQKLPQSPTTQQRPTTQQQTPKQTLLDYRRANNLCFKCGEKFQPGHQCKQRQFNSMEEAEQCQLEELHDNLEENPVQTNAMPIMEEDPDTLEISINALTGSVGSSTIRIQGTIKGRSLSILVDTGSTHSFVTPGWSKEGVELVQTTPLLITVANGEQLQSTAKCNQLSWKMQGHTFQHDFRVLQMGGSDMVLGVDWMRTYSPILMDFNEMTLSFMKEGKQILLHGGKKDPVLKLISEDKMLKLTQKNPELQGELFLFCAEDNDSDVPSTIHPLLREFQDIFTEPTTLPPARSHDHTILLKPGSQPVNLRPYRYPYHQKTEIEKQIADLLAASIIQHSKSPFASPCLLVKKKDGTWRLCVDYRQLNSLTVKDKYPIPVVEDLLDELNGAQYYSKIDLRSGYWQIRIKKDDIQKTAFRTHHGHFEFKVMPFGLTNAPATFQSLMNDIFRPYLRKFVLVFFDDILVYSSTMHDHLLHLRKVLSILRVHQLFARRKKCFFGQQSVEYLGHIISKEGVATDPSKVSAMKNWPHPSTLKSLRGFLGLTGYYRKFIRNYGAISRPLTALLKKDSFHWSKEATSAFQTLKEAMCTAPVLALPNFSKPFTLETDATTGLIHSNGSGSEETGLSHHEYPAQNKTVKKDNITTAI
ncbi:hypothetical protein GQ457_03G011630 [Hibiscus cannabinus]